VGRMLAIRVHGERISKALCIRFIQAAQYCRSLAYVLRKDDDAQAGILFCDVEQSFCRAIGAAVYHHPYRIPETARLPYRVIDFLSRVVAGDQHQVRGGWCWVGDCHDVFVMLAADGAPDSVRDEADER